MGPYGTMSWWIKVKSHQGAHLGILTFNTLLLFDKALKQNVSDFDTVLHLVFDVQNKLSLQSFTNLEV